MIIKLLISWIGAYLLGSLPPGIFWTWVAKGIDIRKHGSGRTGGTNVWRTAGSLAALLTALSDGLKGAAGIWLARALGLDDWGIAVAGTMAIVGHNYSLYLGFHGGAGTVTSVGVSSALWPHTLPGLTACGVFLGWLVGHASVSSIIIAILLPIIYGLRGELAYALGFGLPTMLLTLWALRPNIRRLLNREERFLPIYWEKPPLVRLSRHPAHTKAPTQ